MEKAATDGKGHGNYPLVLAAEERPPTASLKFCLSIPVFLIRLTRGAAGANIPIL
jgi:hypothetical protein